MKPAFVQRFGQRNFPVSSFLSFAMTYDAEEFSNRVSLTGLGVGPMVTEQGFLGNGYDSRYNASLPAWFGSAGDSLSMQATVKVLQGPRNSTRDAVISIGDSNPKMQLAVMPDSVNPGGSLQVAVRTYNGSSQAYKLNRRDWVYRGQYPQLTAGSYKARPQGIKFIDSDTLLVCAHYEDTLSRCHRIDLTTGEVTGSFNLTAGASHFSAICKRESDSSFWFFDYLASKLYRVDVPASIAAGNMVYDIEFTLSALTGAGSVEWITYSGTEYLLVAEYRTTGSPYLYAIASAQVVNGATFALANRFKRFVIQQRNQGLKYHAGQLYISLNRLTADAQTHGKIHTSDIMAAMASVADGSALAVGTVYEAPSQYPEDIDFHPVTGQLWTSTEGMSSVGDVDGFLSIWSADLGTPAENTYTIFYAANKLTIKINDLLFGQYTVTPNQAPVHIVIGGAFGQTAGQQNGFFIGSVKNIYVSLAQIDSAKYAQIISGYYESDSLTKVALSITNPGAESGVTGWTNEVGGLATRAANPAPHSGSAYFSGGSNVQTIARQRFDLLAATGLTGAQLDAEIAAGAWARVNWWQAGFGGADTDMCAMGVRFLDASSAQISLTYNGIFQIVPNLVWIYRGMPLAIPAGARYLDLVYRSDRSSGTNNDGYIDDIECAVYLK